MHDGKKLFVERKMSTTGFQNTDVIFILKMSPAETIITVFLPNR